MERQLPSRQYFLNTVVAAVAHTHRFTDRPLEDDSIQRRIISARLSSRKERRQHAKAIKVADAESREG